jgi:hypothetical protein
LPVTFPSLTSGAVEDEPAAQALGTVQPNGAGVTKVNGADGIDLSSSLSSARMDTDNVLVGSKEVDGSNGVPPTSAVAPGTTSETQAKQQEVSEESDDEEVEELPEPEKEETDTSHGDIYLDTVSNPILDLSLSLSHTH